jgi:hypothetical protein
MLRQKKKGNTRNTQRGNEHPYRTEVGNPEGKRLIGTGPWEWAYNTKTGINLYDTAALIFSYSCGNYTKKNMLGIQHSGKK